MKKYFYLIWITLLMLYSQGQAQEVFIPRLSPLPEDIEKQQVSLNGKWSFHTSPEEKFWEKKQISGWETIEVPGEWVMQGFNVEKEKTAGYYRTFTIPESWRGKRIKLRCNGIYSDSRIYINGEEAGSHLGGFTAFELDVTALIYYGKENRIAVSVASESLADATSNASRYAVHPLGGIVRDLYLFALPEVNLAMFHTSTSFDTLYTDAILTTEIAIANESKSEVSNLSLHFALTDAEGNKVSLKSAVYSFRKLLPGLIEKRTISFDIPRPIKWDSEHPYLYTLTCQLKENRDVLYTTVRRVGFRQIEVRGNQMFINNMPVKLRGVCRHEVMPLRGRSLNGDIWKKDVELFRCANVNYIRTSHYPPDEALLEACDELGMFVEVEAPFCWAHETKVPEEKREAVLVNQHVEMVNLNRSHPSVIMWSIGNESNLFTEYFQRASEVVRQIDPTRPRIFSQWKPDADGGMLEVTNHHYPGPSGPDLYRNSKRPVVFDEFCHLNAYNRLELAADPGLRNMWGVLLDEMWNRMYYSQGVLGGAIWAGIDDTFFLPEEKVVGYGTWGPIDGWRREKPEYWGMKKAFSPVKVIQEGNMSSEGKVRFRVENRYNFSNLSECKLEWRAGKKKGTVITDIAPRSADTVEIQLPESLRHTEVLDLSIIGIHGFVVDQYRFRVLPEKVDFVRKPVKGELICEEKEESIDIRINRCSFSVSRRDGKLSVRSNGKEILCRVPVLMLLPLNGEGEGIQMTGKNQNFIPFNPVCENWIAQSISHTFSEKEVKVRVTGAYEEAQGILEYRIGADEKLTVSYDFTTRQELHPRQIGLVFALPASFTELSWKRKGYWSVYPKDHIGALEGNVKAFDSNLPISGVAGPSSLPSIPWAFDQTAAGSNIFRSTKENIYKAILKSTDGGVLRVESDGTQHIRTWVDKDLVYLLVANYNNAGKENFLVSHAKKGYKTFHKGNRVQGIVNLFFSK